MSRKKTRTVPLGLIDSEREPKAPWRFSRLSPKAGNEKLKIHRTLRETRKISCLIVQKDQEFRQNPRRRNLAGVARK
jgi:ribosomal protein L39E